MPNFVRKIVLGMLIVFAIGFSIVIAKGLFDAEVIASDYTGIGEERFSWSREIYDGVEYRHTISYNNNKDQKTNTITFDPKAVKLKPIIAYGGNALYGSTMTSLIDHEEKQGQHVVFGINGDAYDTSNGIANGLVINNGVLITSSNAALGWGMLADGTIKYGSAKLKMEASIAGESPLTLKHVNKERKLDTSGVYLLTSDFNDVTASKEAGVEVVLDIDDEDKDLGLRIGETLSANVVAINEVSKNTSPSGNQTAIGKHQVVLSTHVNSPHYQRLKTLAIGTQVDFNIDDVEDDRIDWSEVVVGMGIFHLLLDNGTVPAGILENPDIHPRTSMGIKADGTVILMQNDGRQIGWANGLSFKEMIEYMRDELGAVTIFNFDGGGSSTMQITMPGNNMAEIVNRPSDGSERANTNALLFIAEEAAVPGNPVEKIHLYPDIEGNNANKIMLLEKGKLQFALKATDRNYYHSSLEGKSITYEVENDSSFVIGTITEDGVFTAASGKGSGRVIARVDDLSVAFEIEIVDEITSIETDLTILSIAPGKTVAMDFRAFNNGVPVMLSNESLAFTLNPSTLGTISESGVFTAQEGSGTGSLEVKYKDFSFLIPVEVGKMPVPILDFETDIFADGWLKKYTNIPGNGGSGSISINHDERYVKHGDGSLRIDYDFATTPLTGTVAIEIGETGFTTLEGQPTAIGAWIYGDGNGGWFRIQMTGGKYAGSTYIDWVGWKYIETPIPTDAPFPYQLQNAVRLLGTATIANHKKGTIYVDSVRAIYDFRNDDDYGPEVVEGSILPAQDSETDDLQATIGLKVKDAVVEGSPYTGINIARTKMYINNREVTNIQQSLNPDGSVDIAYIPSALDRLRPGVQNIRVRTEDNFGNKTFTEWSFVVTGYAVNIEEVVPKVNKIYAGDEFEYKITTPSYKDFAAVELELEYDKDNLTLEDIIVDSRLSITQETINEINGKVLLTVVGMDGFEKDDSEFINFKFKAKMIVNGTTGIKMISARVLEEASWYDIYLNGFNVPLDYKYIFSYKGSTIRGNTVLTVTEDGVPVAGASFIVIKDGVEIDITGTTNANGTLTTDLFGQYALGSQFAVRAVKDGYYSNETTITVVPSLGTLIPEKITITVGANASTSVGIGFQTSHEVNDAKVVVSLSEDLNDPLEFDATSKQIITTQGGIDREYTSWGAYVTGLTANTKYFYKVGSSQGWSSVYSFTTAKESGDFNIAFYGDIQGGYVNFPKVVDELYKLYPDIDLSMLAGDVSDNAHIYNEWTALDDNNKQYFNNNIWAAAIGNHDVSDGGEAFTGFFYGPNNGTAGQNGARNYWFEINDVVIFNLDTEAAFNSYDPNFTKQIELMRQVMNNTTKQYKIVLMHRSAYPLNYNEANIRELAPVFEELNIDIVLSGHDHVYSRTTMAEGAKTEVGNGVTYVVGGSASGSKYYDGDLSRPWVNVVYDKNNPVFSILKFSGDKLYFEAYAIEYGNVVMIDSFIIGKTQIIDGDVNLDGIVDVEDAKLILKAITGKIELNEDQLLAAGIEGEPTLSDVRRILRLFMEETNE